MATGFLELLSAVDRELVLAGSSRNAYAAGTVSHREDDGRLAFVVESGLIRLFVSSDDGRRASVVYLHPGDSFAVLDVLPGPPGQLQAILDSSVLVIPPQNLSRLATENPSVAEAALRILGRELGHLVRIITVRSLGSMTERLAFDLLERASDAQLKMGDLAIEATHEDLAESIGSTREVVTRLIGGLRQSRIVTTSPGRIRVLRPAALWDIVRGLMDRELDAVPLRISSTGTS